MRLLVLCFGIEVSFTNRLMSVLKVSINLWI